MNTQRFTWIEIFLLLLLLALAATTQAATVSAAPSQQASVLAVVANGGASLVAAPDGDVPRELNAGVVVTAVAQTEDGAWTQVETRDNTTGWVESARLIAVGLDTLPKTTPQPSATATSAAVVAISDTATPSTAPPQNRAANRPQSAVVRGDGAALRQSPNGDAIEQLKAGAILSAVSSVDGWIEVRNADGVTGWVAEDQVLVLAVATATPPTAQVTAAPSPTPTPTSTATPDYPLGTIAQLGTQRLNVRSAPASDATIIGKADGEESYPCGRAMKPAIGSSCS
ncbi:MAG: SH3 domain-containing protein [Caldilineaceae bacterium]